ncbi:MAG: arginine--tRNA ligase [Nanoarchaeota archaeon]|nr:arginine--tRNA ligase [Nanoarchaeota archaeon]
MDFAEQIQALLKKTLQLEGTLEIPPDTKLGDYAFPCFNLAKTYKKSPHQIAQELSKQLHADFLEKVEANGPYINFFVKKSDLMTQVVTTILNQETTYGSAKKKKKILIEYPSPNTNKPLHLGHIRNILLGSTISNLYQYQGNTIIHANLNNDRGIHICKSMLAYQKWGKGKQPDKKTDHFVGDYYVRFAQEAANHPELEQEAQTMLQAWEAGDKDIRKLWKQMNTWAEEGFATTYKKFNLTFDKTYYESDIYDKGKTLVLEYLKKGVFTKDEKGAVIIDLTNEGLDKKVLLRSDGTTVYMTQDLYLAQLKEQEYHPDTSIYVVAHEQNYHFKVLFTLLNKLKIAKPETCYHLAYGMVYLPEGKMKSREGNVVDADDLIETMTNIAREELIKRYPKITKKELERRAEAIGMAALRFHILKYDPLSDITFNPQETISFEGETGPYLQYTIARINSIFTKYGTLPKKADLNLLTTPEDHLLASMLYQFSSILEEATNHYKIHYLTQYLIRLAQAFSNYYEHHQILKAEPALRDARLHLCKTVHNVLSIGLTLLGITILEEM